MSYKINHKQVLCYVCDICYKSVDADAYIGDSEQGFCEVCNMEYQI